MKVSAHAAKRFLERVMNKTKYTYSEVGFTIEYLEKIFNSISPGSYARPFIIPGFESYKAIYRDNTVITIIHKGNTYTS